MAILDSENESGIWVLLKEAKCESKQLVGGWVRFLVLWWTEEKLWSIAQRCVFVEQKSVKQNLLLIGPANSNHLTFSQFSQIHCHCIRMSLPLPGNDAHLFESKSCEFSNFPVQCNYDLEERLGFVTSLELCWKTKLTPAGPKVHAQRVIKNTSNKKRKT